MGKITTTDYSGRRAELYEKHRATAFESLQRKIAALGDDAMLNEFEAAAFLDKSVQWLRNRRINGNRETYPPYSKIGGGVRYRFGSLKLAA